MILHSYVKLPEGSHKAIQWLRGSNSLCVWGIHIPLYSTVQWGSRPRSSNRVSQPSNRQVRYLEGTGFNFSSTSYVDMSGQWNPMDQLSSPGSAILKFARPIEPSFSSAVKFRVQTGIDHYRASNNHISNRYVALPLVTRRDLYGFMKLNMVGIQWDVSPTMCLV